MARLRLIIDQAGGAVGAHHAVEQPDRIGDHARIHVVVDGDRHAQLLAGVLVQQRVVALRHRELAQHPVVETVFRLVGAAEQTEGAGRTHQAVGVGPFAPVGVAVVGAVLQHVGVGEQQERDLAHAVIDRGRGASDAARRRAAAGVDLLAEADLEPQHVGRGLRPERIGGAGAGQARHHQAVDLVLVDAGLVEQLFENLAGQHPDVAVALLHHLGFGVGHDRVVTQAHCSLPIAVQAAVGVAVVPAKRARLVPARAEPAYLSNRSRVRMFEPLRRTGFRLSRARTRSAGMTAEVVAA